MRSFNFYEKARHVTVADIYTQTFFVVMNKGRYESLPEDLKGIIHRNSGKAMSIKAGRAYDEADVPSKAFCLSEGVQAFGLAAKDQERFRQLTSPLTHQWVEDMEAKGLPGREVLSDAKKLLGQAR
jgi:TRAP-type C4-dicarboxylate transport system substrate-binding protein